MMQPSLVNPRSAERQLCFRAICIQLFAIAAEVIGDYSTDRQLLTYHDGQFALTTHLVHTVTSQIATSQLAVSHSLVLVGGPSGLFKDSLLMSH